jgi:hypothetical protein
MFAKTRSAARLEMSWRVSTLCPSSQTSALSQFEKSTIIDTLNPVNHSLASIPT